MAMNPPYDWRRADRRLYAAVAILFPIIVLIGFGPTYYLKGAFNGPPLPGLVVHLHGLLMSAWIALFIAQVYLISSKRVKVHQRLGIVGVILGSAIVVVGTMTGVAAAARGSGVPGIPPLSFLIVPLGDVFVFAVLLAAAVYYRRDLRTHKRLILLTVLNFLPPALGRFPFAAASTPPFFWGVPAVLAIILVAYDSWQNRKVNKVFLAGALFMIASYAVRIPISSTEAWLRFAAWLTSWAG